MGTAASAIYLEHEAIKGNVTAADFEKSKKSRKSKIRVKRLQKSSQKSRKGRVAR